MFENFRKKTLISSDINAKLQNFSFVYSEFHLQKVMWSWMRDI